MESLFNGLSLKELFKCRELLDNAISEALSEHKQVANSKDINNYINYYDEYIDSFEEKSILEDVESLNIDYSANDSTKHLWLTEINQDYTWKSKKSNKKFSNPPVNIGEYQGFNDVTKKLNTDFKLQLNSCLLNIYPNGHSGIKLHDDDEWEIDHTQPICVISFWSVRKVDFYGRYQNSDENPMLSLEPVSGSLYMMMPGCQEYFRHQVPSSRTRCGPRCSVSFRAMIPRGELAAKLSFLPLQLPMLNRAVEKDYATATITEISTDSPRITMSDKSISPVKELVSIFESNVSVSQKSRSPVKELVTNPKSNDIVVNGTEQDNPSSNTHHKILPNSSPHKNSQKTLKRTTVLFGTSITLNVDGNRLAYGGRKCINISESGAKISDISRMVEHFYFNNPSSNDVDKVIFSFGTNDIKYQKNGVYKFKKLILNLINKTKELFPHVTIFFQSVLPMKLQSYYTANNFLTFNRLLIDLCMSERCSFIDCFYDFVSGNDYNRVLYKDNLHLNKRGIGLLCRWLKHTINHQTFNPYVY